ncbi:MAG TPA: drug/metabolite exporter YedA [Rubricoccaceae bacterium]|nr:drug/metabolite exporter YedA [Rubricoccaceae bacterium]
MSAPVSPPTERAAPLAGVLAAFAAVYVIWGSTYLAIRFAIETIPPFGMAGVRFLTAGAVLYGVSRARGAPRPTARQWRATAVIGALLLLGGNGGVVWAEQFIPSGVAALLVACMPIWMVLLDWLRPGGARPSGMVVAGLALGLAGIVLLVGPDELVGGGRIDPLGAGAVVFATLTWAAGSLYARTAPTPRETLLSVGMQMLAGGGLLLLTGLATGEAASFEPAAVTAHSALALGYLVVFGSLIAYTAYVWLLGVAPAARVATYAYVNPVVAVLLGWALADEPLTARVLAASVVIVGAVVLITRARAPRVDARRT